MINNNCQPPSASGSPRFCNMGNFMRLPHAASAEGLDFAVVGIPFDTAASFRAGARFGPNGVRNISAMIKPNNVAMGVNIMDSLKGADLGDVPVIPDYIHETYDAIEQMLDGILECGAVPISIGGDHAVTLGELRAVAKKHGKVSLVHFDSHLDLCDTVFGQKYNHGTPFRRAMEEELIDPSKSVQIGMRGSLYDPDDFKIAADLGFTVISGDKLHTFTPEVGGFIGRPSLFSDGGCSASGELPERVFLMFATVFCSTATTIVSGAMAGRTKFKAYLTYSAVMSGIVYPITGHWIWNSGGSLLAAQGDIAASKLGDIFFNTNISAAACAVTAMFITWARYGKPDVTMTLNGALAGLVASTAGCDVVSSAGAFVIGITAGFVMVFGIELITKLKVDDPVGAVSVHGLCGAWGTLMTGIFAKKSGLIYSGSAKGFLIQLAGVLSAALWTALVMTLVFTVIKKTMRLRVSENTEIVISTVPLGLLIDTIRKVLYTGKIGDGKIFVYDVANVVKIRTGAEDEQALE